MKHKYRIAIVFLVLALGLFSVGGQLFTGMTGDDWLFTPVAIALTGLELSLCFGSRRTRCHG